ncbi:hypothetical protein ROHU_020851 [Labeo rohita]|uniref:Uncharacterized protein n=1 Tax=Labeo rohita TaxID=84645 RepID=A0A498N3I1_LABRO|nr:hypothetical protein ROHU_020851 [Labeo rohita]
MGLPLPVQQSRGSLRSQCGPSVYHLSCAACSVADGALPPGAAEPRLPLVAVGAPRPIHCRKGDSLFRCSRAEAPFGSNESPSTTRSESFWLIQHRTGLPLPVQQGHGSLRSQCEPSICRLKLRCVLGADGAFPPGAAEPWLPSVAVGALHPIRRRKGDSPSGCSRAAAPFGSNESPSISLRSQCGPSVCQLSYAAYSAADGALPPGAAELQAPFGHSGSPRPTHQNVPHLRLQEGLALPVQQSRSSLRKQQEPLI